MLFDADRYILADVDKYIRKPPPESLFKRERREISTPEESAYEQFFGFAPEPAVSTVVPKPKPAPPREFRPEQISELVSREELLKVEPALPITTKVERGFVRDTTPPLLKALTATSMGTFTEPTLTPQLRGRAEKWPSVREVGWNVGRTLEEITTGLFYHIPKEVMHAIQNPPKREEGELALWENMIVGLLQRYKPVLQEAMAGHPTGVVREVLNQPDLLLDVWIASGLVGRFAKGARLAATERAATKLTGMGISKETYGALGIAPGGELEALKALETPLGKIPAVAPKVGKPIQLFAEKKIAPTTKAEGLQQRFVDAFTEYMKPERTTGISSDVATAFEKPKIKELKKPVPGEEALRVQREMGERLKGEAGAVEIPTAEEFGRGLTGVERDLAQFNYYHRYVGKPLWEKGVVAGFRKLPKGMQEFLAGPELPRRYNQIKNEGIAKVGIVREEAVRTEKALAEFENVKDFMTSPEARARAVAEGKLPGEIQLARQRIDELGQAHVDLGLLSQETFDRGAGVYLRRLYETKEAAKLEKVNQYLRAGVPRIRGAQLKRRGEWKTVSIKFLDKWKTEGWEVRRVHKTGKKADIWKEWPEELRQQWGEIQEGSYLAARTIADLGRDVEIGKMIQGIVRDPEWSSAVPKEGYRQVLMNQKYQKVTGVKDRYFLDSVADDLEALFPVKRNVGVEWWDGMLGLWKYGKAPLNPATHFRNIVSNTVLAGLGGLPPWRIDIYSTALKHLAQKGKYFQECRSTGLLGTSWFEAEIKGLYNKWSGLATETGPRKFWKLSERIKFDRPGQLYQAEEQWFKLSKYIHNRQKGMSVLDAADDAKKWLFDYTTLPPLGQQLRRYVYPFVTFQYKALPVVAETAVKHPLRIGAVYAGIKYLNDYAKQTLGLGDAEEEMLWRNVPDYLKGGATVLLPTKTKEGEFQFFNLTYFLPWGDISETGGFGAPSVLGNVFPPSNPVFRVPIEIVYNKKAWGGQEIFTASEIEARKQGKPIPWLKKAGAQVVEAAVPPLAPGGYGFRQLKEAVTGEPISRTGRTRKLLPTALGVGLGLRTTPVAIEEAEGYRQYGVDKRVQELRREMRKTVADIRLSDEEAIRKAQGIADLIAGLEESR